MTITFVGAGNVASHLAPAFAAAGHIIVSIYSRTLSSAITLATAVGQGSVAVDNIAHILPADLYVVSVVDAAIADLVGAWPESCRDGLVVHTSGSTPADALSPISKTYGVLYPLQTFTRDKSLNLQNITCFIEASNEVTSLHIMRLANSIFGKVEHLDFEHRKLIHLAAVFACNFSNHMVALGYEILEQASISPDCLTPLLQETFSKCLTVHPHHGQTGPARRHDHNIINEHERLLSSNIPLQHLYRLISQSIEERF